MTKPPQRIREIAKPIFKVIAGACILGTMIHGMSKSARGDPEISFFDGRLKIESKKTRIAPFEPFGNTLFPDNLYYVFDTNTGKEHLWNYQTTLEHQLRLFFLFKETKSPNWEITKEPSGKMYLTRGDSTNIDSTRIAQLWESSLYRLGLKDYSSGKNLTDFINKKN